MRFLSGLFGGNKYSDGPVVNPFLVDMHSHLLPGIDDGSDSFDESVEMISHLAETGYKKFITTPHIMSDFYRNTPEIILPLCEKLNAVLKERKINVSVEASAEYYLDENFLNLLDSGKLLAFGTKKYVLIETSFLSAPPNLSEIIFKLKIAGYMPILAHPERYTYMYDDFNKYKDIFDRDICFQINLASLGGYYSKDAKRIAEKLIKEKMVHFIGTDIHHIRHLDPLLQGMKTPSFAALSDLNLLNNTLL